MLKTSLALAAFGFAGALLTTPPAVANPDCATTSPNTTWCTTKGSTQIVTAPAPRSFTPPWFGAIVLDGVAGRP